MSINDSKTWLIAYDIADARRLRRVHRELSRHGATVQYSAFSVPASTHRLDRLLGDLGSIIDEAADDLRAYALPSRCQIWTLGVQDMPQGVAVDADLAARLLLATTASRSQMQAHDLNATDTIGAWSMHR